MDTIDRASEDFSLSEGGPFHDALVKMRLYNNQGKLAVVGLCITWLPLVIITAIEGTLYAGTQLPFLKDVAMQARLLVALPMLIVIGATISLVKGSVYSGLEGGTASWMTATKEGNQTLSFAGDWAVFISIPLFQFFLLRWLWRYFVWVLLLFRLSKTPLSLLPSHADRAGGLGIFILAQRNFNLIFVAASVVISGQLIAQLTLDPDSFSTIRNEVIGYIVICLILVLFPLLFFTGKLAKTKHQGLVDLSNLSADLSRKFEEEWVNDLPIERRIAEKQADPSMVFDYSGIYDSLQQLRIIPILFIHFSVGELLKRILGLLM